SIPPGPKIPSTLTSSVFVAAAFLAILLHALLPGRRKARVAPLFQGGMSCKKLALRHRIRECAACNQTIKIAHRSSGGSGDNGSGSTPGGTFGGKGEAG
ncbi:MAG: hypothetical protein ACREDR_34905, partial [Blastocatellia bacterium]